MAELSESENECEKKIHEKLKNNEKLNYMNSLDHSSNIIPRHGN